MATRVLRLALAPNGAEALPLALPLRWPDKPAGAVLDYTCDATELLAGATDTLSAAVAVAGATLVSTYVEGGRVLVWLGGGVAGQDAAVLLSLTTASGRAARRAIRVLCT